MVSLPQIFYAPKYPAASNPYTLDFSESVPSGDTITSVTMQITPGGSLACPSPATFAGALVSFVLAGGLAGSDYSVAAIATTAAGLTLVESATIAVIAEATDTNDAMQGIPAAPLLGANGLGFLPVAPGNGLEIANGILIFVPSGVDISTAVVMPSDGGNAIPLSDAIGARLLLSGGTMNGYLTLCGNPTLPYHAGNKSYIDAGDSASVVAAQNATSSAGSAVTTANAAQTTANTALSNAAAATASAASALSAAQAAQTTANTALADATAASGGTANALPLAGGTMSGPLILSGDPTNVLGAVSKEYADAITSAFSTSIGQEAVLRATADTTQSNQITALATQQSNLLADIELAPTAANPQMTGVARIGQAGGNTLHLASSASGSPLAIAADGTSTDANVGIVIQPLGSGALMANLPSSSTAGGNARGTYAVDWQMARTTVAQVASGTGAFIGGGLSNTASGAESVVPGGSSNTASGAQAFATGKNTTASGTAGTTLGIGSQDRGYIGSRSHSSGYRASPGDVQTVEGTMFAVGQANASQVILTRDGNTAGTTNQINLPLLTGARVMIEAHAFDSTSATTAATNCVCWSTVVIVNVNSTGVVTVQGTTSPTAQVSNGTGANCALAIHNDNTNLACAVGFTPPSGNTAIWRTACYFRALEQQ